MSQFEVNNCTLSGRLGADAELRYTQDGKPVLSFRMAVSRNKPDKENPGQWLDKTIWMRVTSFGPRGNDLAPKLTKGTRVIVSGQLDEVRAYTSEAGKSGISTEFIANDVTLMDRPARSEDGEDRQPVASKPASKPKQSVAVMDEPEDLNDLPFRSPRSLDEPWRNWFSGV